jgi:hypothetical protein
VRGVERAAPGSVLGRRRWVRVFSFVSDAREKHTAWLASNFGRYFL